LACRAPLPPRTSPACFGRHARPVQARGRELSDPAPRAPTPNARTASHRSLCFIAGAPPRQSLPFPRDTVAAAADTNPDFPGSCARCYQVRCRSGYVLGAHPSLPHPLARGTAALPRSPAAAHAPPVPAYAAIELAFGMLQQPGNRPAWTRPQPRPRARAQTTPVRRSTSPRRTPSTCPASRARCATRSAARGRATTPRTGASSTRAAGERARASAGLWGLLGPVLLRGLGFARRRASSHRVAVEGAEDPAGERWTCPQGPQCPLPPTNQPRPPPNPRPTACCACRDEARVLTIRVIDTCPCRQVLPDGAQPGAHRGAAGWINWQIGTHVGARDTSPARHWCGEPCLHGVRRRTTGPPTNPPSPACALGPARRRARRGARRRGQAPGSVLRRPRGHIPL
jgi:hypothetical protein